MRTELPALYILYKQQLIPKIQVTQDPRAVLESHGLSFELLLGGPTAVMLNVFAPLHHLAKTPWWFSTWTELSTFILDVCQPALCAGAELHAELLCVARPSSRQLDISPG